MASTMRNVLFTSLMILVSVFGVVVGGNIHKVGDSNGWTMMGMDYESWTASKAFQVGDSLVFHYNNELHDVTQVTPDDFKLCDTTKPLANKYQTGSDTIILTKPGFYNFICGVASHCEMGQKVQILVQPAFLSSVDGSSSSYLSPSPAPLQSGASILLASWIGFGIGFDLMIIICFLLLHCF